MNTLALLHPSTLLGAELRETLGRRRELWREVLLLTTDEAEAGTLTEVAGTAAVVTELQDGDLERVRATFFCGGIGQSRPLVEALPRGATAIVLSPDASPDDGHPVVADVNLETVESGTTLVSPHPGAVLLAHLLYPLRHLRPERATATLLAPVSTYSRQALDELFEQTRGLLRFDPDPPREIFPTQLAFNVVPAPPEACQVTAQLTTVLGDAAAETTVHTLQAGVFHSYGVSLHVTLAEDPGPEQLRERLAEHPRNDLAVDPETLGMIDAAAREEVIVGPIVPDRERPGSYWIWAVMDNLTCGGAVNAVKILEAVLGQVVH